MKSTDIDLALITESRPLDEVLQVVQTAERAGIQNFWLTEGTKLDLFSVLAVVASNTERIGLGTGIVNIFGRSPLALTQAVNTVLRYMEPERVFNLGLGSSGKQLIEKFYGIPFEKPMARLEEYVRTIDHIFSTGHVPVGEGIYKSQGVAVGTAGRHDGVAPRERVKIFVAGLNPRSVEITGTYADGWLPIWPSKSRGGEAIERLKSAAAAAGRPTPQISAYIYGVISDDPELIQLVRGTLAWYLAANGSVYANMFRRIGYEKEVQEIIDLWQSGDRDGARHIVDQAMLEDVALMGEVAEFGRRVQEFHDAGIDNVILQFPPTTSTHDILAMLAKLEKASTEGGTNSK